MKLDITNAALADLRAIRDYTLDQWGERQEAIYINEMWAKFEEMASHPEHFRERKDLFPGCRIAVQGQHIILFKVDSESLQVVRVLHSAMDFKRHISE